MDLKDTTAYPIGYVRSYLSRFADYQYYQSGVIDGVFSWVNFVDMPSTLPAVSQFTADPLLVEEVMQYLEDMEFDDMISFSDSLTRQIYSTFLELIPKLSPVKWDPYYDSLVKYLTKYHDIGSYIYEFTPRLLPADSPVLRTKHYKYIMSTAVEALKHLSNRSTGTYFDRCIKRPFFLFHAILPFYYRLLPLTDSLSAFLYTLRSFIRNCCQQYLWLLAQPSLVAAN